MEKRCEDVIVCGWQCASKTLTEKKPGVLHFMTKCAVIGYIIEYILMLLTKKKKGF